MNDTQKIEQIKRIIEGTNLSTFENMCSAMTEIIDIVYPMTKPQ
jgi:hypothetical protein